MKFGVREICDVVLKAKAAQKIGNKIFYAGEPVCYFDTLKTSSMEGAATTVYAQGGRGNARLVAWEGERTVTFTMEDALISPEGFMILSGAGLIDATGTKPVYQHMTETVDMSGVRLYDSNTGTGTEATDKSKAKSFTVKLSEKPYLPIDKYDNFAYVMLVKNGEIVSEPYIPEHGEITGSAEDGYVITVKALDTIYTEKTEGEAVSEHKYQIKNVQEANQEENKEEITLPAFDSVMVDYYVAREGNARQIDITPDKFGGNYYLEASTLFRDQNGVDMPAEFIIPNCKIQSNFTFTMASSGDPSSFTFTMDAFPDYTKFEKTKKVLASIQIIEEGGSQSLHRHSTAHEDAHDSKF